MSLYDDEQDLIKKLLKKIMYAEGDLQIQRDECVKFFKSELK